MRTLIVLLALALSACTSIQGQPGGENFEVSTFGSGKVEVTTDSDGSSIVTAESDGTNVLGIATGLFRAVGSIFGGGQAPPDVTVNVAPAPAADAQP